MTGGQENVSNIVNWTGSSPKSGGRRGRWVLCSRNAGVATYASIEKISEELGELRLQRDKSGDPLFRADVDDGT